MEQSQCFRVGVAGATGKFAGLILDHLLKHENVHVRGYCRNPSKIAQRHANASRLELIQGDALDVNNLASFVDGLDVVICAYLGDNNFMVDAQKRLVDACDHARVPRYIASDYCIDYTRLQLGAMPAKDPMKVIHAYVDGKAYVKGVHILIGAFMETFWSPYFHVWDAAGKTLAYYGTGNESWESTTYGDAAQYTAAVALDSDATGFKKFLGDRKNIHEIAEAFQTVYGFKPRVECQGTLDDLYTLMQARFEKEPSNPSAWLALFYQYYCTNGQTYIFDNLDNGDYPQAKPQTFQAFLTAHELEQLPDAMEKLGSGA